MGIRISYTTIGLFLLVTGPFVVWFGYGIYPTLVGLLIPIFWAFMFSLLTIPLGWFLGDSDTSDDDTDGLSSTLIMMTGVGIFFAGVLLFANGYFDRTQAQLHTVVVHTKEESCILGCWYSVGVPYWDAEQRERQVSVPRDLYERLVTDRSTVTIASHPGALGFEWIERVALEGI